MQINWSWCVCVHHHASAHHPRTRWLVCANEINCATGYYIHNIHTIHVKRWFTDKNTRYIFIYDDTMIYHVECKFKLHMTSRLQSGYWIEKKEETIFMLIRLNTFTNWLARMQKHELARATVAYVITVAVARQFRFTCYPFFPFLYGSDLFLNVRNHFDGWMDNFNHIFKGSLPLNEVSWANSSKIYHA